MSFTFRESRLRTIARYPFRHIRWKIIAPYAVLSLIIAVAGTFLVTRLVVGSLEERFNNQLAEAARVTADSFVRRERAHLEVVRGVAFTEGVPQAVEDGNEIALAEIANPIGVNNGAERIEILDASGDRIFGSQLAPNSRTEYQALDDDATDRPTWAIVESVLEGREDGLGDKFAQIVQTDDGYVLYTAGPIKSGDSLVGAVLVGSKLSSFLPAAKLEALADITVYDFDGAPLSTTFAESGGDDADLTPADEAFAADSPDAAVREHKNLYGRGFDLLYGELVVRDQAVGRYSVALPTSFMLEASSAARYQVGGLFTAGILAVLFVGWLVARGLTRPLLQLVGVARAVHDGDLNARARIHTLDEVGTLASSFDEMTARLQRQHLQTIKALTGAIDARDPGTLGHSVRVGQLAVMLGDQIGVPDSLSQHLEIGGYLHDIGKIGIRDDVLLKAGALSPEERAIIEQHPRIGLDILAPVELPKEVLNFVGGHHEKLDGSGYPLGIKGEELTIVTRIGTVADIYDALVTDRPYKKGFSPEQCMEILMRDVWDGKLDQEIVEAMQRLVPRWEARRRDDPTLKGFALPQWRDQAA